MTTVCVLFLIKIYSTFDFSSQISQENAGMDKYQLNHYFFSNYDSYVTTAFHYHLEKTVFSYILNSKNSVYK